MKELNLNEEENNLLDSLESGEWNSVDNLKLMNFILKLNLII